MPPRLSKVEPICWAGTLMPGSSPALIGTGPFGVRNKIRCAHLLRGHADARQLACTSQTRGPLRTYIWSALTTKRAHLLRRHVDAWQLA